MNLKEFFEKHPKIALGFSGGVDSSYLFYAANKYGADIKAYYIKTQFQPEFELEDAFEVAKHIEADFELVEYDSLQNEDVTANDENRCYYCKQKIFGKILELAKRDGYTTIIDGTNASDDEGERPGMRALKEMEVLSPLRICGLTKDDVRSLSKEAGLKTWDKPSYSCLATRVATGERLTAEKLSAIERGEKTLMEMGFKDFRLRLRAGEARLEVRPQQMSYAIEKRKEIINALKGDFEKVSPNMEER